MSTSHSSRFPLNWPEPSCSSPHTATGIARSWPRAGSGKPTSSPTNNRPRSQSPSVPTRRRELVWTWTTSPARRINLRSGWPPTPRSWRRRSARHDRESCAASRPPSKFPTCSTTPSSAATGSRSTGWNQIRVYRYSLGDGTRDGWGPWQTVKTAPARKAGVSFLYLGDAQTGLEGWGRLLAAAHRRHPAIDFILLAGDLVDRGNERIQLGSFLPPRRRRLRPRAPDALRRQPRVSRRWAQRSIAHSSSSLETARAESPLTSSTISRPATPASPCLTARSPPTTPPPPQRRQTGSTRTLARTRASWKFVMLHHPIYPSHPWRDLPACASDSCPSSTSTTSISSSRATTTPTREPTLSVPTLAHHAPAGGTIYLMAVSGDKFVEHTDRDYVEVGRSGVSTYQTFEIDPRSNRLTYRAWTEDGTVIDELSIVKKAAGGRTICDALILCTRTTSFRSI